MTDSPRLIYSDDDVLAFYKAGGIPTVPLKEKRGGTLLEAVAEKYPEVLEVHGRNPWEGGVIHRLDTETSGIVLVVRTQEAYDKLQKEQEEDKILKTYRAKVTVRENTLEGFEPFPYGSSFFKPVVIKSYFRSFGPKGASVRPVRSNPRYLTGRVYETRVEQGRDGFVLCQITRGFRHQIRSHLSWSGHPIVGDSRYGGIADDKLWLEAVKVEFLSPSTGKTLVIKV